MGRLISLGLFILPACGAGDDVADTTTDSTTDETTGAGEETTGEETTGEETTGGEPPALSQVECVLLIVEAFETGDPAALDCICEDFRQHSPEFPDGKGFYEQIYQGEPTGFFTETYRVFEDGNVVFSHNGFGPGEVETVSFDVFEFSEEGCVMAHYDAASDIAPDGDGTSQVDGVTGAPNGNEDATEDTRALAEALVAGILAGGQWSQLDQYFLLPGMVQHSAGFGPDGSGLAMLAMTMMDGVPLYAQSAIQLYADGEFALVGSEGFPDEETGLPSKFYDLFRFEDGLVVEHWDTFTPIDESTWVNDNGPWPPNP